ncbi:MAG TPA: c-type cytochrome [Thermoanaerobaculia bacterium]|nr:c-type cytochrome [Thermoanaerobaculia bacterium]
MKPQEPIPHNYSIRRLNLIFAVSSLGLLLVTGGMVMYDYVRGWKWFQFEFMRIQRERIEQELEAKRRASGEEELKRLDERMRESEVEIARNRSQYVIARKELEEWEGKHYAADQDFRFAKARLDAARYEVEAAVVQKRSDAAARRKAYDDLARHVQALQLRLEQVTRGRDAARLRVDGWMAKIREIEDRKKELTASIELLQKQLRRVAPTGNFFVLNAPMLDFIAPTFRIEQVIVNDLFIDMNYLQVPRVDRCQTCHRAIDVPGYESKKEAGRLAAELQAKLDSFQIPPQRREETEKRIEQLRRRAEAPRDIRNPFRTHPKLDLFVGSSSPHPLLEYGCTGCHRGQDRGTEFSRAGHTPASRRMEKRWKKASWLTLGFFPLPSDFEKRNWGYAPNPYLETPMYPRQYYEAACIKCHSGQMEVSGGGEKINRATAMLELYGCHACHRINNWRFADLRKPGPDLNGIAEKTTPEWAFRWIADPHAFRPTTRMPSFFFQRNMIGPTVPPDEKARNIRYQEAEIHSIVTYLFAKSTRRQWQAPGGGDAVRGRQIVETVGCLACHVSEETVKDGESGRVRPARRTDFPLERNFGFNLVGTGTKSHPGWLFHWVKNPKGYYAGAPMPSLRLTDAEAADVTAYLMTLRKPEFMQRPVRPPDPNAVFELAKGYMVGTMTIRDAEARLRAMPLQEQLVFLGQRSIEKYGCYSCHEIRGFEGLKPIGTELTTEGSKNVHLFDFGFVHDYEHEDGKREHVLHTVPSWIYNKLRSPRIYDDARTKPYNDKLKMPNFHLTEEEAQALTMVVAGLTKERVAAHRLAATDPRSRAIEEGRKLISQNNCRGCHVIAGKGRAIAPFIADENFLPPDLTPQGGRAQSNWLFNFLKDPTVMKIRPWMQVRMPTFHFTDEQANKLVAAFAAEGKIAPFDNRQYVDPPPANVAIGRHVFEMLRCAQCHATNPVDPENPPAPNVADTTSLAPNLTLSRIRLRHEWIPDWIRRPGEMIPGTRMPANFPRDAATGGFQSPLALAIDTPQFAAHKAALLPYFGSEAELKRAMSDAVALTDYLRDYIWSIGIRQMRAARPGTGEPGLRVPAQPSLPPATPVRTGSVEGAGGAPAGE